MRRRRKTPTRHLFNRVEAAAKKVISCDLSCNYFNNSKRDFIVKMEQMDVDSKVVLNEVFYKVLCKKTKRKLI